MAKGNLIFLGGLAAIAAIALNKKSGTNRSANIGSSLKETLDLTDAKSLVKIINSSPELQEYLKKTLGSGRAGKDGLNGADGINGTNGVDGINSGNFGGGIAPFLNSNGTVKNANTSLSNSSYRGRKVINMLGYVSINLRTINTAKVYVCEGFFKNDAVDYIALIAKDSSLVDVNAFNGVSILSQTLPINGAYTYRKFYFTFPTSITAYDSINLEFSHNSNIYTISHIVFKEVNLGEAVPSNLANLPKDQEVKDPTTGDRGIYNGTTVDWYTMV